MTIFQHNPYLSFQKPLARVHYHPKEVSFGTSQDVPCSISYLSKEISKLYTEISHNNFNDYQTKLLDAREKAIKDTNQKIKELDLAIDLLKQEYLREIELTTVTLLFYGSLINQHKENLENLHVELHRNLHTIFQSVLQLQNPS